MNMNTIVGILFTDAVNLTITGAGFGDQPSSQGLTLGNEALTVIFYNDTEITALLPNLPPGDYDLQIHVEDKGLADLR